MTLKTPTYATYWWHPSGNSKPKSRYIILFSLKGLHGITGYSRSEYDDLHECYNECDELDDMYDNHPIPVLKDNLEIKKGKPHNICFDNIWDYNNGKSWWGYLVLDMKECKAIRVGGFGLFIKRGFDTYRYISSCKDVNNDARLRDFFFRDTNICPDDYDWQDGEYNGWLQYKWGDGKNAIGYIEPPKQKKNKIEKNELIDAVDNDCPNENYDIDLIENTFANMIDKEISKRMRDKCGW